MITFDQARAALGTKIKMALDVEVIAVGLDLHGEYLAGSIASSGTIIPIRIRLEHIDIVSMPSP